MTIKKEAGKYYAIFTAETGNANPRVENTNPVGMDLGIHSFIALSDGTKIKKPGFMRKQCRKIARWQRILAKRHRGSRRREEAKLRLQRK